MERLPVIRYIPKSTAHLKMSACVCAILYSGIHYVFFQEIDDKTYQKLDTTSCYLALMAAGLSFSTVFCMPQQKPKGKPEVCTLGMFFGFLSSGILVTCVVLQCMEILHDVNQRKVTDHPVYKKKSSGNKRDLGWQEWVELIPRVLGVVFLVIGATYCFIFTFKTFEENRYLKPPKKKLNDVTATDGVDGIIRQPITTEEIVEIVRVALMTERQLQNPTIVHHVAEAIEEASALPPPVVQVPVVVQSGKGQDTVLRGPNELPPSYSETTLPSQSGAAKISPSAPTFRNC